MEKIIHSHPISFDSSLTKVYRRPKKELKIIASQIGESDEFKDVFPKENQDDLLYIGLVSYSIGAVNKNGCIITPEEGLSTYKTLVSKPLNLEHEKNDIIGFCTSAFLTNIKNNKILSEDEASTILDNNGIVNVAGVFVCWKINSPDVAEIIEENFDENSEYFNKIKASFEFYFNDFDFFLYEGGNSFSDGELISSDDENAEEMYNALIINGGSGRYNGKKIAIAPKGGLCGGTAITFNPANIYSDTFAKKDGDKVIVIENSEIIKDCESEKSVIINTGENMLNAVKTEPKTEVVAEVAKEVVASIPLTVDKGVADEMQKQLDLKIGELNEAKNREATILASQEELKKQVQINADMATKIQEQLDNEVALRKELEAKENDRVQKELIASRMSKLAEVVDVNESNKCILEKECVGCDEDFNKKLDFYKTISKKVIASQVTSTEAVKETVKDAVIETAKETKGVNIIVQAPDESLVGKFAKAFSAPKDFGFSHKKLTD